MVFIIDSDKGLTVGWNSEVLSGVNITEWANAQTNPTSIAVNSDVSGMPYDGGYWLVELEIAFNGMWKILKATQVGIGSAALVHYENTCVNGGWAGWDKVITNADKPSGYYTGNGSNAQRQIVVGGSGRIVFIASPDGCALVGSSGGILARNTGNYASSLMWSEAGYENGVLTLNTTNIVLNGSGKETYYQVL